jgi:hypothetical protein
VRDAYRSSYCADNETEQPRLRCLISSGYNVQLHVVAESSPTPIRARQLCIFDFSAARQAATGMQLQRYRLSIVPVNIA